MLSSIYYGEIQSDKLVSWKENKDPYNILVENTRPRKITTLHTRLSLPPEVPSTITSSPSYPSVSASHAENTSRDMKKQLAQTVCTY